MARFRLFDPVPQWTTALHALAAGGTLNFYNTGTSTPRVVYNAVTGGDSLGSTLTIDADGRLSEDFYLDGEYRVILKDGDGATIWQRDNVQDVASGGLEIPDAADATDGQALFSDGTSGGFYWDDVLTIPTQTGNSGKYLTTDGEALSWAAFAEEEAGTTVESTASSAGSITVGSVKIQWGTGTCPTASSTLFSTVAITFGAAFSGSPYAVVCTPTSTGVSNNNPPDDASISATSLSTTGFTARAFVGAENSASTISIVGTIGFTYIAIGPA